jgi:hypothetical protein
MTDPTAPPVLSPRDDIKACIAYYEERGLDWLSAVGFIAAQALGVLPQDVMNRYHQRRRKAKP